MSFEPAMVDNDANTYVLLSYTQLLRLELMCTLYISLDVGLSQEKKM